MVGFAFNTSDMIAFDVGSDGCCSPRCHDDDGDGLLRFGVDGCWSPAGPPLFVAVGQVRFDFVRMKMT